jgi:hypothetical protein
MARRDLPDLDTSPWFDRLMALLGVWFEGGLVLDLWAHSRGLVARTEGFFTPWHVAFYLGYIALAAMLARATLRNHVTGRSWRSAIPSGYGFAAAGALVFFFSGLADFAKHTLTGFDLAAEAPIDPSHLGITLGMGLIVSGPLRAAWLRTDQGAKWSSGWPATLSLAGVFTSVTLVTQFSSPLAKVWADPAVLALFRPDTFYAPSLAISGMLIYAALLVGFFLSSMRRGILPPGSFGVVMAYNAALMTVQYSQYRLIPAAVIAGLLFDVLAHRLRGEARGPLWQLAAAAIPVIFFGLYFLSLALMGRLGWPFHVWTAALVIVGAAGWGLGLIMHR